MTRIVLASSAIVLAALSCSGGGDDGNGPDVDVQYETCPSSLCPTPPACGSGEVLTCCTCVRAPVRAAVTTTCDLLGEYCSSTAGNPDISCFMPGGFPTQEPEGSATLHGPVDVYATGVDSDDILVQVYRGDTADGNLGALVGEYVSDTTCPDHEADYPTHTETADEVADCPGPCQEKMSPDNHDCRNLGYYVIEGVPTNVPLIIKTSDASGTSWKDMLSFNIWLFDDDIGADGGIAGHVYHKARVLSVDDWRNIPVAAGDTSGIAAGHAAVAGELHDCNDVRISFAMAATFPDANTLTYFNGVEEHLYPDLSRSVYGTNIDGLYASIEMEASPAGEPVYVSAIAQVGDEVVSLGWQKAFVFPETLTSVTLRGTRPDQVD